MDPKNVIIYTDMDGTLLTDRDLGLEVPNSNLLAIKKWIGLGGQFSVATGRNLKNALAFFDELEVNLPMVLVNGAMGYKQDTQEIIYQETIPNAFLEEAITYYKKHKHVGLILSDHKEVYSIFHKDSLKEPEFDFSMIKIPLNEIKNINVLKITYFINQEDSDKVIDEIKHFISISEVNVFPASKNFIEIVSKHASKALGINRVLGNSNKTLVCIGDYLNDLEMLDNADIAAAPLNGHEITKNSAQIITVENNEGAIADLIDKILKM